MTSIVAWHTTMSLDGYTADRDGSVSWASGYGPTPPQADELLADAAVILTGRRSYDAGVALGQKMYGGAWAGPVLVLTHRPTPDEPDPDFRFLDASIRDAIALARLRAGAGNVIVTGSDVAAQCLEAGLIDEALIHVVPVLLGGGTRLFAGPADRGPLPLQPCAVTRSGLITTLRFTLTPGCA
jgi:dihydrofolate reductase